MPYIVELEKGVWLASWSGDPGRTLNLESAKIFDSIGQAERALVWARDYRSFEQARIHNRQAKIDEFIYNENHGEKLHYPEER